MCGIIGCIGEAAAQPFLIEGLGRLEYRGYDSAGVAIWNGKDIQTRKSVGRVSRLAEALNDSPLDGDTGISHTRWATHGSVTEQNAHPHFDASGRLALVHNGVLENHKTLRDGLRDRGHAFVSQTDTEVLAHLIGEAFDNSPVQDREALVAAVRYALGQALGTYGIGLLHADTGRFLIAARKGSPLIVGFGDGGQFLSSDVDAIADWVNEVIYLEDGDIATLDGNSYEVHRVSGGEATSPAPVRVEVPPKREGRGRYAHFMHKEIHEQPDTLREAMKGRLDREGATATFSGLQRTNEELREWHRIVLTGCGTTYHAALAGESLIEALARIPVECEYASEFRYRNVPLDSRTAVFAMSQSGETADTIAALRESKRKGAPTLGICNNVISTIARESEGGIGLRAGLEIGVAATKTFTSQVVALSMLGLLLGRIRDLPHCEGMDIIRGLESLPELVARTLELDQEISHIAAKYVSARNFLFMGRQANFPIALEGALKMKEISYIPASGYPSAELKHGVIALVNEETPSIFLAPQDGVYEKNLSNIEEVKARKGPVIAIGTEGDETLTSLCDDVILLPQVPEFLAPVLNVIPLQLFAYHTAVALGCDVDKPKNLAKSVTVE